MVEQYCTSLPYTSAISNRSKPFRSKVIEYIMVIVRGKRTLLPDSATGGINQLVDGLISHLILSAQWYRELYGHTGHIPQFPGMPGEYAITQNCTEDIPFKSCEYKSTTLYCRYCRKIRWIQKHRAVQKIFQECQKSTKTQRCTEDIPGMSGEYKTQHCREDIPGILGEYKNTALYRTYSRHARWVHSRTQHCTENYSKHTRWLQEHSIFQPCQVSTRIWRCTEEMPAIPGDNKNTVLY